MLLQCQIIVYYNLKSLFLGLDLLEVEFQFSTFKNVTVAAARLTRSGRYTSVDDTSSELISQRVINMGIDLTGFQLTLNVIGLLGFLSGNILSEGK
jgi:hypothetical protein